MQDKKRNYPKLKWKDKHKDVVFTFTFIPVDEINIPPIQRDISNSLVEKVFQSIEKVGFVVPPVIFKASDDKYYVIDGQHRLMAAKMAGYKNIPVIIIPAELAQFILTFNIEKPSNLRDKAKQAYRLYKEILESHPDIKENEMLYYIDQPYYVTVGIVINEINEKFSGSMFENFLRKVDNTPLEIELSAAYDIRKDMAKQLYNLYEKINEIYYELGTKNALIKSEIFRKAFQGVYGKRVRNIEDDFYTAINKLSQYLEENKDEIINELKQSE